MLPPSKGKVSTSSFGPNLRCRQHESIWHVNCTSEKNKLQYIYTRLLTFSSREICRSQIIDFFRESCEKHARKLV